MVVRCGKVLSDSHLLAVIVPKDCTDRLQPLNLSVNKAVNDKLRQSFTACYASKVKHEIESGICVQDGWVATRLSVMKVLKAKWLVST